MSALPEPGPVRDRMVAEVVGWDATEPGWCWDADLSVRRHPSTSPADALAALEAWVARKDGAIEDRGYGIFLKGTGKYVVELWRSNQPPWYGRGDTLPSAATAALLQTKEEA